MIGQGVYTLSEVSQFTRVPCSTVRSWFRSVSRDQNRGPIFRSDYEAVGDDFAVSFLNLIEVRIASFFRDEGVKPGIIRRTHEILQAELHTPHPFAHEDLRTDGARLIRAKAGKKLTVKWVDAISKQLLFPQFRDGLKGIGYNQATKLADEWGIEKGVVIKPSVGFGKPVVVNTGISTNILANQYIANQKDAALVARLFKVTVESVLSAFKFESDYGRMAA
jgi:uncharacterized protein (DUF433 family)